MSDNPHANGGLLLKDLRLPDFRRFGVDVPAPGGTVAEATKVLGQWLADVVRSNPDNFRIFGPDETASNRLQAVYEATDKQWNAEFDSPRSTTTSPGWAGWSRCSRRTSVRAGWRATC